MVIRRYKRGEESAVWNVYFAATRESIARDYHADLIDRWAPHDQDMVQWANRLAKKNPFVAIVDEGIVGMAEIEPSGFIDYFYVHPRWQSRGIGKALLLTLEAEAAKSGVSVIWADVSVTAHRFFLTRGFRVTEVKSNIILGHPAPNFRMQKTLNSEPADCTEPGDVAREIVRRLEEDGWFWVRTRGSHHQYKHSSKPGLVTVPGRPGDELAPGTLNSILKQAGLK